MSDQLLDFIFSSTGSAAAPQPSAKASDGIFDALLMQESGGRQLDKSGAPVTSKAGATGIAQVMPATAPEAAALAGLPWDESRYKTDADYNRALGKAYFEKQLADFGNAPQALAAYNAGPGAVRRAVSTAAKNGQPDAWLNFLPEETRNYVPSILSRAKATPVAGGQVAPAPAKANFYTPENTHFVGAPPVPAPTRSAGEAVADTAIGFGASLLQGIGLLANTFGADNAASRGLREAADDLTSMQSPARQAQRAVRAAEIKFADEYGSAWDEVVAYAGAFADAPVETVLSAIGTSAPTLLVAAIPGLNGAAAARLVATGAMGAAQGGGSVKGQIYEAVYNKLTEKGVDPDTAAKTAAGAQAYNGPNLDQILLGMGIGGAAATTGFERALGAVVSRRAAAEVAADASGKAAPGIVARVGSGVAKESPIEGLQGGQERVASNVALQREGYDVPTFQGATGGFTLDALASAPLGAAGGLLNPVAAKAQEPNTPLSKAATAGNVATEAQPPAPPPMEPGQRLAELEAIGQQGGVFTPGQQQEYESLKGARDATPGAVPDDITPKTFAIRDQLRADRGVLDALRADTSPTKPQAFLKDLSIATSKSAQPAMREQALARVEMAMDWAASNPAPTIEADLDALPGLAQGDARPDAPRPTATQLRAGADRDAALIAERDGAQASQAGNQTRAEADRRDQAAIDIESSPSATPDALDRAVALRQQAAALRRRADEADAQPGAAGATGAMTERDRAGIDEQRQINLQRNMRAPDRSQPIPEQNRPAPIATAEQAQLEASSLAGKDADRKKQDDPRQVVVDRALRNVEERGGVASPAEARIFQEAGVGKPYDRIDESLVGELSTDEKLTQATGIALGRAPRESQRQGQQSEADLVAQEQRDRSDSRMQALAADRAARQTDQPAAQPAAPPAADGVIQALKTIPALRTAEQKAVVDAARRGYTAEQMRVMSDAAVNPANLSATDRLQLRQMREARKSEERMSAPQGLPDVAIPAGAGPAFLRKRKAQIEAAAAQGYETVERRDGVFVMRNTKTDAEVRLSGRADAALAREAVRKMADERTKAGPKKDAIEAAAAQAAQSPANNLPEPTDAQKEAGNYKKGLVRFDGLEVSIETPKGAVRRSKADDPNPWEVEMPAHYGYIRGTTGSDGDHVDLTIGPAGNNGRYWVINQNHAPGGKKTGHDEHKLFTGVESAEEAVALYKKSFANNWGDKVFASVSDEFDVAGIKAALPGMSKPEPVTGGSSAAPAADVAAAVEPEAGSFTVRMGGKDVTFERRGVEALGEKESPERDGAATKISKRSAALIKAIARALGKKVVFFADVNGVRPGDGFVVPNDPDTIYLNEVSTISPLAVMGHEFLHTLRQTNPKAWAAIADVVKGRVKDAKGFRRDYYGAEEAEARGDGALDEGQGSELEELVSDLGGNLMADQKFWEEVFAKIRADNGAEAKGIIARLVAALQQAINKVATVVKGPKYRADGFVTELDAIRAAYRDGLAAYLQKAGESKAGMQAEVLKSAQREKTPQTETAAFKRWFGASKVVDANGKPLMVFHGGQKLTAWNKKGDDSQVYGGHAEAVKREYGSMLGKEERQALDKPVHFFTDDESVAEGYGDQGSNYEVRRQYLRMERPLDLRVDVAGAEAVERAMRMIRGDDYELPAPGYSQARKISQDLRWNWPEVREVVEAAGHDGIILYDADVRDRGQHTSYAVFESAQIKSATNNSGAFDPENPDITKSPERGIHFSKRELSSINGAYYGTGLKGAEAERLRDSNDARLKTRAYFYIDEGNGVRPEAGVGGYAHEAKLPLLYDAKANPDKIWNSGDINATESRILDAGYAGYFVKKHETGQGFAVVIGDAAKAIQAKRITDPKIQSGVPNMPPETLSKGLMSKEMAEIDTSAIPGAKMRAGILTIPADSRDAANAEMARIGSPIRFSKERSANPYADLRGDDRKKFMAEQRRLGIDLYKTGLSVREVSSALGTFSPAAVKRWLNKAGVIRSMAEASGGTMERRLEAVRLHQEGLGAKEIAKQLGGVTDHGVYGWLKSAGVQTRSMSEAQAMRATQGRQNIRGVRSVVATKWGAIRADSVYEAARLRQLELDEAVKEVRRSVDTIPWGGGRLYSPDLVVEMLDGSVRVEEIKPTFQKNLPEVLAKAKAATELLSEKGIEYRIVDTNDLLDAFDLLVGARGLGFASDEDAARFKSSLKTARSAAKAASTGALRSAERTDDQAVEQDELNEIRRAHEDSGTFLLAPNGRRSNLSERQWLHVRTASFKTWFGPWEEYAAAGKSVWLDGAGEVSKAVDSNGEPLILYHGTDTGGFTTFSRPGGKQRGDLGIFTTDDRDVASSYVHKGRAKDIELDQGPRTKKELEDLGYSFDENEEGKVELTTPDGYFQGEFDTEKAAVEYAIDTYDSTAVAGDQPGIYALFINIRNPNESHFEGANWDGTRQGQWMIRDENGEPVYSEDGSAYFEDRDDALSVVMQKGGEIEEADDHYETTDSVVREARRMGQDGAIIRQVVDDGGGAGSYSASDLFVALDPNQVKSADFNSGEYSATEDDIRKSASRDHTRVHEFEVSTRTPYAKATKTFAPEDARENLLISDFAAGLGQEKWLTAVTDLVETYPNYRAAPTAATPEKKLERMVKQMVENLTWLHDQVPAATRARSKLWYDGARAIAERWVKKYGITDAQAAGILAVLSPQKDWFMNVSLANRVADILTERQAFRWSKQMDETASRIFGKDAYDEDIAAIRGETLQDIDDPYLRAMWLRVYDQAHNPASFYIVSPEGDFVAEARTKDGTLGRVAWGGNSTLAKAVSIFEDGSFDNISTSLGRMHKVRNFYNNILVPNSPNGHVTIDTHAVAAALLRPLSGNSLEVKHNFSGPSSAHAGLKGSYALYEEAYRRAAGERGILPREMQSITWEAIRGLYVPGFKSQKRNVDAVDAVWEQYSKGRLSYEKARQQVFELGGRIDPPSWEGRDPGAYVEDESAADDGDVAEDGVSAGDSADDDGAARDRAGASARRSASRDRSRRDQGRSLAPLAGAPTVQGAAGPDPRLVEVAEKYAAARGIKLRRQAEYVQVDEARAKRIAEAYEAMPHAPQDPKVKAAYADLIQQTRAQYDALVEAGYEFYLFDETSDPYQGNPWNAMRDLRANKRMGVFATEAGFGSSELDVADNPLLADTGITWPYGSMKGDDKRVLANDLFRAVHDAFGHGLEGAGFRAQGEENAWQAHVRLFTGPALGAITSETRGQNSFLNFGPNAERNKTAKVEDTIFADQKTGLMPEWTWQEGRAFDELTMEPDQDLIDLFEDLGAAGQRKKRAEAAASSHPRAQQIKQVNDNILDLLEELESKGALLINCD